MLIARRLLDHAFPAFLPSNHWHPPSPLEKWAGIIVFEVMLFVLLLTLIGLPLAVFFSFLARSQSTNTKPIWADFAFVLVLWVVAFFLLSPSGTLMSQ